MTKLTAEKLTTDIQDRQEQNQTLVFSFTVQPHPPQSFLLLALQQVRAQDEQSILSRLEQLGAAVFKMAGFSFTTKKSYTITKWTSQPC